MKASRLRTACLAADFRCSLPPGASTRWGGGGAATFCRFIKLKITYFSLNMPAPCPPRSACPGSPALNPRARVLEGFSATTSVGMRLSERWQLLSHVEQWLEAKFCDETGTIPKNEQKSLVLIAYSSSADQSTPVGRVQTITQGDGLVTSKTHDGKRDRALIVDILFHVSRCV